MSSHASLPLLLLLSVLTGAASAASDALPGCQENCGNATIPYPFGIGEGCHLPGFKVTCNTTFDPPKMFMNNGNIEFLKISLDDVRIATLIARQCYASSLDPSHIWSNLKGTPYTFSNSRNRFTALGCDTLALIQGDNSTGYTGGCVSVCTDESSVTNGTCSGIACCQTAIPAGLKRFDSTLGQLVSYNATWSFSPCGYAFLIDQDEYVFSVPDLIGFRARRRVPTVLDWAIGNETCKVAVRSPDYACGENSHCIDSTNGPGYRCSCNSGYSGNPHLKQGCQDVDECKDPNSNPCVKICTNTPGGYACSCPRGTYGDGRKDGKGCIDEHKAFPLMQSVLGSGLGLLFLLICGSWLYWALKKRRLMRLRESFFKQNGGLLLQQQLASRGGSSVETARIFTADELKRATDNYNESRILGRGGYGTVYRGVLQDGRVVAIKKSKVVDESQIEQFINEVVILSRVIHRNVVKILGCCLETEVPLLVYEYVSNGTLFHHVHRARGTLAWPDRLRIAAETAAALGYLHSAAAEPIFHRDVKSANILLDGRLTAKVSDFGASRLVPLDRAQVTTLVQGTLGYLDPEYFQTGQLTEKSDVYSFGVVLAELLTGEKPISEARPDEERNLAMHFIVAMRGGRLFEVLEGRVREEGEGEQIMTVARIARRCLRLKGEERPKMKEVAAELERARRYERTESFVDETTTVYVDGQEDEPTMSAYFTGTFEAGQDVSSGFESRVLLPVNLQR
ncbi:Wall-associated receptor kinase 5 [Acorus gramineus]|uniref:Wall-associated receptor kinase 5 n=1 Tax=Acorus gramineus TaxID=55184 RepID=A0AAV9B1Y2_ACOGR|nr:Wall-associated receptor kinase 5 [Acorus gramineus]